ncbi:MAG: glycosyltransferase family 1 protein, partial [Nitrosopumilales archaeon]
LNSYTIVPEIVAFTKTEWTGQQVLSNTGLNCSLVGTSINIDMFRRRPQTNSGKARPVVIAAMIRPSTPYREPGLTMYVLREISKHYGDMVEIRLFGCSPEGLLETELPLDFNWKLAGVLNQNQVANFFNDVDIFVDFSSHQAMGLTALEAMACGSAVIVPENGGARSYGIHGKNCLFVNTSRPELCVSAIKQLLDNSVLRRIISKNAINDVCSYYPEAAAYNILKVLFGEE